MVKLVILSYLLTMMICVAHGQCQSCQTNIAGNCCSQTCGCVPDDSLMKSSVIALQSQTQQMMGEIVKLRHDIANINNGVKSAANMKQCSKRNIYDDSERGPLFECAFVKTQDGTVLRVVWNGNLRLTHTGSKPGSCRRWYFTLNGDECSQPDKIDMQLYALVNNPNSFRPSYVEGYCRGVPAGPVIVTWNVGDCPGYYSTTYGVGNSFTGWGLTTARIIVEEVTVENANNVIV
ncbi:hypothetical protein LSAT2_000258 [Lamellibrachia satsuma]|nr:hypothetical protein LSAT2_000258 [Lamellibrachia satsuma]